MKQRGRPVPTLIALVLISLLASLVMPLVASQPVTAATYFGGPITSDTMWTMPSSPYVVTSDVVVVENACLTIQPGVVVKFRPEKSMQIDGCLVAAGIEANPIVFTSDKTDPTPGDWGGILFTDSSIDATYDSNGNYQDGSIVRYCTVEYSGYGTLSLAAVSSSPLIDCCVIKNNAYRGVSVEEGSPRICSNTIENNGSSGVYAHTQSGGTPPGVLIRGNHIHGNLAAGVCVAGINAIIESNTITGNSAIYGGGILSGPSIGQVVIISNNTIMGNEAELGGGIFNSQYYGEVTMVGNTITANSATNDGGGIWTSYGWQGKTTIHHNEITGNTVGSTPGGGIAIGGGQPVINYNNIHDNTPYDVRNGLPWNAPSVDATNNWWGTTDSALIQQQIYDWHADSSLGYVIFNPYHDSRVDITPPTTPVVTDDGAATKSASQLHASWSASDPESGIAEYEYAIGTAAKGTDVLGWTSVGTNTQVTKIGLSLAVGTTYYFSVKARNGDWMWSDVGVSDGIKYVAIPDINQDGKVDYKDLAILGAHYGCCVSDPSYNASADINGDGCIDYKDLAMLGAHYGEVYQS